MLQLNRCRCGRSHPFFPFLFLLFPLPVPSSQNESSTAVTADVIATRHHWCYDNSKSSLSLIHRSILGYRWIFQIMHCNTLRLQPFSPCCPLGNVIILFIFQNTVVTNAVEEVEARLCYLNPNEVKVTFKILLIQMKQISFNLTLNIEILLCDEKRQQHLL